MKKDKIIIGLLGIVIGISIAMLFQKSTREQKSALVEIKTGESDSYRMKKQAVEQADQFAHRVDSFNQIAVAINKELIAVQKDLAKAAKKNNMLQARVYNLVHNENRSGEIDTVRYFTDCDSLKSQAILLVRNDDEKDSLNEIIGDHYKVQLLVKDSVINIQRRQYEGLTKLFNESIQQGQLLTTRLVSFEKQARKQRRRNKFLAVGALLIAGFATHDLLIR